jgi:hypothetical protein
MEGVMGPNRAALRLEAAARQTADPIIRDGLLELARRFREIANPVSHADNSKADNVVPAERMVGSRT